MKAQAKHLPRQHQSRRTNGVMHSIGDFLVLCLQWLWLETHTSFQLFLSIPWKCLRSPLLHCVHLLGCSLLLSPV
uniref:Uncharacterized protein n=1 Tax=Piliocolobus tephrosceles TaxID=591936 RepID=A0A8C9GKX1_9PRIM